MKNVYDNGTLILGTKKDILEYQKKLIKKEIIDKDDYQEITETLEDLENDTIVMINYDCGMGLSFDWWNKTDIVKTDI